MKKLILVIALAAVAFASCAGAQEIRIATEGAYPPFNSLKADGTLEGFDVDIANALCAEMKATCTGGFKDEVRLAIDNKQRPP